MLIRKSKIKLHSRKNDEGYVIVAVLAVAFLAVMIVSSISAITISDLVFNAKVRAAIEARHAAESALDSYYAAINASTRATAPDGSSKFAEDILVSSEKFQVQDTGETPIAGPFVDVTAEEPTSSTDFNRKRFSTGFSSQWFRVDDDGIIHLCDVDQNSNPCFRMRLSRVQTFYGASAGSLGGFDERNEYIVDVAVRHKCRFQDENGNWQGCTFSRFQQQFRQREFINHVMVSDSEALSESAIEAYLDGGGSPAFAAQLNDYNALAIDDSFQGNIHTNDEVFYVCNSFSFNGGGFITSKGSDINEVLKPVFEEDGGFDECESAPSLLGVNILDREAFEIPTRAQDQEGTRLKELARSESSNYVIDGSAEIFFDGPSGVEIDGVSTSMPRNGVIFVENNAVVHGIVNGRVTIFAGGDIIIGNGSSTNLEYGSNNSLTGLIAGKDIVLDCYQPTPGGSCEPKLVEALLLAKKLDYSTPPNADGFYEGGTIYNNKWASSPVSGTIPVMELNGAMISGYRGTFGAMSATTDGRVASGWLKDFKYDPRLKFEQPPYMLRDSLSRYIRSTSKDLPCDEFCTSDLSVDGL